MTKLKYIAAGVLLFVVSFVGGCVGADAKTAEADEQNRMSWIESSDDFEIYRDNRTGVHYLVKSEWHGYGGGTAMCVLVDADGKPLVDKER